MKKKRFLRKLAPTIVAAAIVLILSVLIGVLIRVRLADEAPAWLVYPYIAIYAAEIVAIIAVLIERIHEINGGEEDEAAQY